MTATSTPSVTPARIMQLMWSFTLPLAIESAIRNRVFDVLDEGAKTIPEIARQTGASERGLRSVIELLAGIDLLSRDAQGRYSLTPESAAFLVSTKQGFQGGLFRHMSGQLLPNFLQLSEVVRTGKPATRVDGQQDGTAFFEQLVGDIFPMSYPAAQTLAKSLDVLRKDAPVRVLDLATGSGVWGIALAQSSPHVTVTGVDWPNVAEVTKRMAAQFGLTDRFEFICGNLREVDLGTGYQVAVFGHILHSEGETESRKLLKRVFHALAPGGTIAIAEFLVDADRKGPMSGLIFAVNMLVNTSEGSTYSFEQISEWLREAGYGNPRLLDAPGPSPLILADKPK